MRDEDGVDPLALVSVGDADPTRGEVLARRLGAEQEQRGAVVRAKVRPDARERRQQLVVRDAEARFAQARGEPGGRDVAPVREERQRTPGGADPLEHLAGAGQQVHLLAVAVHERAVDVEHEALDVVKSHGATPRGRRPS